MTTPSVVLRGARRADQTLVDIVIEEGRIAQITPPGRSDAAGEVVDVDGRYVGPGLWDAHVHFTQWVIRSRRLDLTGTANADEVLAVVRRALESDAPRTDGVLIGYGFRDGLWPAPPSLAAFDAVAPNDPVVLVSGDLHCAWVNSAGAARLGMTLDETGLILEGDWMRAQHRLDEVAHLSPAAYREVADAAARRGVVGIVEYEIADNLGDWRTRIDAGVTSLRVDAAVWPDRLEETIAAGLRTGDVLHDSGLLQMGRLKVVVDGSLNTRTAWCWDPYPGLDPSHPHACGMESVPMPELRRLLERARGAGIEAAVHAIGDRANSEVLDVFGALGMQGIIEHAQFVREDDFARFAPLGLIASVQPEHAMDDRDVADRFWAGRTDRAFAFGSLHRAGAALRLGSDAPVSPLDPWQALASATVRSRGDREPWHPEQRLDLGVAMESSSRTRLAVGEPADLVVFDRDPAACTRDELRDMPVSATLLGGRFTWRSL